MCGDVGADSDTPKMRVTLSLDGSPHLDQFASRGDREAIVRRSDLSAIDLLVTLHFAGEPASSDMA